MMKPIIDSEGQRGFCNDRGKNGITKDNEVGGRIGSQGGKANFPRSLAIKRRGITTDSEPSLQPHGPKLFRKPRVSGHVYNPRTEEAKMVDLRGSLAS